MCNVLYRTALPCRDGDLKKAKLYATELMRDSEDLMKALQNSSTFYAARTFDGVIDLATEIGALHITACITPCRMCQDHALALKTPAAPIILSAQAGMLTQSFPVESQDHP